MYDLNEYYEIVYSNTVLRSLVIIIASVVVAKATDFVFTIMFNKLVQKSKTTLDDRILQLLHKPIFYSILSIGFILSIRTALLPEYIEFSIVGCLKTVTIIIWLYVVSKILTMSTDWASKQTEKNKVLQKNTLPLFNNLGKIGIGIFGIYFIFLSWDININGILASAGVLGVVLGLAAKDTVSNFFAGIFLLADAPYKEGDYILLDTGERGYVKKMGLRSTRFMTRDDIEITIPNSVIASSKIVNESGGPNEIERVRITLLVSYGSDLDKVRTLLIAIAEGENNVMENPKPRVRFREFSDHGLKLQLLFWIHNPEIRGVTVDAVNTQIYKQLSKNDISIPFPTMNVNLSNSLD
ncbi:MAG: mechanosensitive ion channel protein [Candidatus Marinimicrobia bacterium]|nr:mechanosensitive ion channel protein [Candidatus Neomarinimicrobiota bacterium]|tara:strand:+ start:1823 stop:2881 length:1059 start_codon:yes stop_codon:yes gene_type:complete